MLARYLTPEDTGNHNSWAEGRHALGHALLPVLFVVQAVLLPTHIFTTDYLDPASRFTLMSIGLRLGSVVFFALLFLTVRRFKLAPEWYYSICFIINGVQDGLIASHSEAEFLVTHTLGFGVVILGYAIIPVWSVGLYSLMMLITTGISVAFFPFFSPLTTAEVLQNGGAFVLFFLVIGPAVALLRYTFAKSEFEKRRQIAGLLDSVREKNEELNSLNEELKSVNDNLSSTLTLVQGLQKDLERKNQDLEDSIRYARRIQDAVIFRPELEQKMAQAFGDAGLLLRPRDIVSGDFYYFGEVDDKAILVCADCTGHGIPGAMVSLIGHNLFHKAIHEQRITAPDQILAFVEREFQHLIVSEQVQDGMDAVVLTWDKRTKTGSFAGANRPVLVKHAGGMELIKGSPVPIGSNFYENKQFEAFAIPAGTEAIYLFSDGLQDQFGRDDDTADTSRKRKFGFRQLQEQLEACQHQSMGQQLLSLQQVVAAWQKDEPQTDDQLLLGIRFN